MCDCVRYKFIFKKVNAGQKRSSAFGCGFFDSKKGNHATTITEDEQSKITQTKNKELTLASWVISTAGLRSKHMATMFTIVAAKICPKFFIYSLMHFFYCASNTFHTAHIFMCRTFHCNIITDALCSTSSHKCSLYLAHLIFPVY